MKNCFKHPKWTAWLMADYVSVRKPGIRVVVNLATDPEYIVDDSIDDVKCSHKEAVKALERIVDMPFNRFLAYIKARL